MPSSWGLVPSDMNSGGTTWSIVLSKIWLCMSCKSLFKSANKKTQIHWLDSVLQIEVYSLVAIENSQTGLFFNFVHTNLLRICIKLITEIKYTVFSRHVSFQSSTSIKRDDRAYLITSLLWVQSTHLEGIIHNNREKNRLWNCVTQEKNV